MPLCITCSHPLPHLYTTYSKADDRTLGKGVRLTQCPNCKRFADKYVEHDYVVLFIDLVLIKPQVYRHLLFNRLNTATSFAKGRKDRLDPSIARLGILLVLFDVYITWARIEKGSTSARDGVAGVTGSVLTTWPILSQYFFFLTLNIVATLAQHITIRMLTQYLLGTPKDLVEAQTTANHSRTSSQATATAATHTRNTSSDLTSPTSTTGQPNPDTDPQNTPRPGLATPSAISTALLVSSCTKLFPILLVIWPTSSSSTDADSGSSGPFASRAASYIGWVVLVNNIEALLILLDCGYLVASGLAAAGMISRFMVEGWLLASVGLQRDGSGPVGDFLGMVGWIRGGLG
ncbi:hypothetical protein PMZ80_010929 [Knufia obscura]|uniref:Protein ARV n=2 Tax=Knufia TaxID=430999 RepID=A0AAN8EG77_9EURO|nr:hypothetical protein PMZ80_010929 [Knufia obscura]KAK5948870.1 hypothetical protein OHC33_010121 [Knufia fluminis]